MNPSDPSSTDLQSDGFVLVLNLGSSLLARLEELNIRAVHVYGLTETYGPQTVRIGRELERAAGRDRARLLARQGHQYPTADPVRVVDDQMRDVPPREPEWAGGERRIN